MKTAPRPQAPKVLWESEISLLFLWEGSDAEPPQVASLLYTTCSDRPRSMPFDRTVFCHTGVPGRHSDPMDHKQKNGEPKLPK